MWDSPEYIAPPTHSHTADWLEQEEALLDKLSFNQQYQERKASPTFTDTNEDLQATRPHSVQQGSIPVLTRSTMEIPEAYRSIFKFCQFNRMQSEAMDQVLYSDENIVISAPTGTGKTSLLELAMIRCLSSQHQQSIKMVYMAPTKSLCAEKAKAWTLSFGALGIKCQEFTGDSDYATMKAIKSSDIVVTTPEKWDSMTRRWIDHKELIGLIKLFMIDEIHILKETRGAILEVCVSRMKTMDHDLRFVAVSATVPNLTDITDWLHASALTFSEEYRPIKLERFVYGYPLKGGNVFAFEKSLDWKLLDIISKHSSNKPVLIFCSTRGSTQSACDTLLKHMDQRNIAPRTEGASANAEMKNKKLSGLVKQGIGFHHAGLDISDRRMVEQLFLNRHIRIVATTSTLAVGVNLPAHLVIIKSTKGYQNGALDEYSDIDILQMIGRAGRPGLDTSGCAAIMTTSDMESKLNSLVSCKSIIESSLHQNLTEHLMSEICIGTIVDVESSIKWMESTFLCVRVKKNPRYYQKICSDDSLSNNSTHQIMHDICLKDMQLLMDHQLVSLRNYGSSSRHQATFYGMTMDRYYIKFNTMLNIMKPRDWNSVKDALELISESTEFETYRYNANEKTVLNSLRSKPDIRFPLKNKVSHLADKIFLMIQCVLGDISMFHPLLGNTLTSASHVILEKACRITRCIIECAAFEKNGIKLKHSLDLYRCMKAKMWSSSPFVLKQIDGIGVQIAKTLSQKSISNFRQLRDCNSGRLEMILHRNPPFGTKIMNHLATFPNFYLDVQQKACLTPHKQPVVELSVTVGLSSPLKTLNTKYGKGSYTIFWIETSDHDLIDFRRIWTRHLMKHHTELTFSVDVTSSSMTVSCHVQSEDYVGFDAVKELKPDIDPMQFITLTKQRPDPLAQDPLEMQYDYTMEADMETVANGQASTDIYQKPVNVLPDDVTIKVEPLEASSVKPRLPPIPNEKPCKHQCKNKRSCKHPCCKRGINIEGQNRLPITNDATLSDNNHTVENSSNDQDAISHPIINLAPLGTCSFTKANDQSLVNTDGEETPGSPTTSTPQVTSSYFQLPSTLSSPLMDICHTHNAVLGNTIDLAQDAAPHSPTSEDFDPWEISGDETGPIATSSASDKLEKYKISDQKLDAISTSPTLEDLHKWNVSDSKLDPTLTSLTSKDLDSWEMPDDKMDDILYSMMLDAEKTTLPSFSKPTDSKSDHCTSDSDIDNYKAENNSINDRNQTMHHEDLTIRNIDRIDPCDWVWNKLADIIYDKQSPSHPDQVNNISSQIPSSTAPHDVYEPSVSGDSSNREDMHRLTNLTRWLQSHVITTVE